MLDWILEIVIYGILKLFGIDPTSERMAQIGIGLMVFMAVGFTVLFLSY